MKILHITDVFDVQCGYQEYYLPLSQSENGHQVMMLTSTMPTRSFGSIFCNEYQVGEQNEGGVLVKRLPKYFSLLNSVVLFKGLKKVLEDFNPDVVHCHAVIYSLCAGQIAFYKKRFGFRLIIDNHAAAFNTNVYSSIPKTIYHFFHSSTIGRYAINKADHLVAISPAEKDYLEAVMPVGSKKVEVIYLGTDCRIFKPENELRPKVRENLGIKNDEVVLVHSGKIHEGKRIGLLINAIADTGLKNIKLLVIGKVTSENHQNELTSFIDKYGLEDNVIWVPFIKKPELNAYYNAADIAVWPGDPSISILDCMATGLPLILPNTPLSKKYLDDNGYLFEKDSELDLTNGLIKLGKNPDLLKAMAIRSRDKAREEYDWNVISNLFIELYKG